MVKWSDFERATIKDIFSKLDSGDVGRAALCRCLTVYPWTQRYFSKFGNLSSPDAIAANPKVAAHGKVVMGGLELAAKNLDDIKNSFKDLSILHSEKLQVDPDNFKLLADCITIVVAGQMGKAFTSEVHAAFEKFLAVAVSSLRKQYY
ncbi:hemoglobin subunit beta [Austrofundulus limnaeus]|uniref:Hemoglobin subunit beta n=1 Tax=Austrofundulus limnaeus TaxID=52670 RepID=A0A2I4CI23_AUSLI|nr:PREDICTED: hemoglobin subunit beta-like [Austrofundulus limnaeus]